eukprot:m.457028 g.457028  ORF g.457028 m.457028 type:complete len:88 (-) comp56981_c2_seq2:2100-2363(-)
MGRRTLCGLCAPLDLFNAEIGPRELGDRKEKHTQDNNETPRKFSKEESYVEFLRARDSCMRVCGIPEHWLEEPLTPDSAGLVVKISL